jgi:uncharacterized protein (DUF849 family)
MLLQATLNGGLLTTDHPVVPITAAQLADDAEACAEAGARAFHLHPRAAGGAETLEPAVIDVVVDMVRGRVGLPVGVSTGAWIEPDPARRVELVSAWHRPDYASVNLGEDGALEVMRALLGSGIGIEAGVWTVWDAELLVSSGLADQIERVLIEITDGVLADALPLARAIHAVLDRGSVRAPRLQHGDGETTWVLIADAVQRGWDTRVGFEDCLLLPDGVRARCNADLVRAARALGAGE